MQQGITYWPPHYDVSEHEGKLTYCLLQWGVNRNPQRTTGIGLYSGNKFKGREVGAMRNNRNDTTCGFPETYFRSPICKTRSPVFTIGAHTACKE
jgi:hypothetical protein